ncbi:MAG: hypothetical protein L0Z73_15530 [Gammaproteobacteria bacterium]|nr:hypothetical protein [Gammaproteobacteria bacterium]
MTGGKLLIQASQVLAFLDPTTAINEPGPRHEGVISLSNRKHSSARSPGNSIARSSHSTGISLADPREHGYDNSDDAFPTSSIPSLA